MVEENQNLSFSEKQLQIIEEGRNIRQRIELLKLFLSLYKNSQLIEIAKNLSLLTAEREKQIKLIREDSIPSDIGRGRKEYWVSKKREIESDFSWREAKLVEAFFDLAEQLTQDIKEFNEKELILYLCRSCLNTAYESDEKRWDSMTPAQAQKITSLMEEQQKEFLLSALFNLMIQKHASQKLAEKIELLIGDIKEYNIDLRDKLLELLANIAENNFEKEEENEEITQIQVSLHSPDN